MNDGQECSLRGPPREMCRSARRAGIEHLAEDIRLSGGHGELPGLLHRHPGSGVATPAVPAPLTVALGRGITKRTGPHSLRHSFITAALDAGVPLLDVQEAASHADPRTTMRYDRARQSLDRHATYIVATFVAGSSRGDTAPPGGRR